MNFERIIVLLVLCLAALGFYLWDLNDRYLACKRANSDLAGLLLADEGEPASEKGRPHVELRKDVVNGDVYIRVDGTHYFQFIGVCGQRT